MVILEVCEVIRGHVPTGAVTPASALDRRVVGSIVPFYRANIVAVVGHGIKMPSVGGDGSEQRPRRRARRGDSIVVTSFAMSGDNQKALEAGGDAYFSKPVSTS